MRNRLLACLVACALVAGCSDSDGSASADAPIVEAEPEDFAPDPALPADVNPVPYLIGDRVALGNLAIRVVEVRDPAGSATSTDLRSIEVDVEITNGALEPVSVDPGSLLVYVDTGVGTAPDGDLGGPLASEETIEHTLRYEVPAASPLLALVFDGADYGDRVSSGLIALDPNFAPEPADS